MKLGRHQILVLLGFFAVYFVWGSTYLAIKWGVETFPPFLMAGTRFLSAGLLLSLYRWSTSRRPFAWEAWRPAVVTGLLFSCSNGIVSFSEQRVPSGIAAVLIGTVSIWVILLNWAFFDHRRPSFWGFLGALLGCMGIYLLPGTTSGGATEVLSVLLLLGSATTWAFGTLFQRKHGRHFPLLDMACLQMAAGGLGNIAIGTFLNEWAQFSLTSISGISFASLLYLILFGSALTLPLFCWLLIHVDPVKVSTYVLVNPVVALLLGFLFAAEPLTWAHLLATAFVVAGVAFVILPIDQILRLLFDKRIERESLPSIRS